MLEFIKFVSCKEGDEKFIVFCIIDINYGCCFE